MSDQIDWDSVSDKSVEDFSLKGLTLTGKCVKVYDGDSIKMVILFADKLYKFTIRLMSIDAPEMKAINPLEKKFAHVVQQKLSDKIFSKIITAKFYGPDKYNRELATVSIGGESINQWLLDNKYAYPYNGGTKQDWSTLL